ncbi:unnamed protein product [Withania somnifera]
MYRLNQATAGPLCLELSGGGAAFHKEAIKDKENMPPEKNAEETTPGKVTENREALRECQMTVPETPSPDQPSDENYGIKRELGNCVEVGARKQHPKITGNARNCGQNGESFLFGNVDNKSRPVSTYAEICSSAAQHFARIREVLVERSVASTLNSGFLTPCRERLFVALGLNLYAVKQQKILHSCLNEFKSVARAL